MDGKGEEKLSERQKGITRREAECRGTFNWNERIKKPVTEKREERGKEGRKEGRKTKEGWTGSSFHLTATGCCNLLNSNPRGRESSREVIFPQNFYRLINPPSLLFERKFQQFFQSIFLWHSNNSWLKIWTNFNLFVLL